MHQTCRCFLHFGLPVYDVTNLHDEVFVITQPWGEQLYHNVVENLARLAVHLTFLRSHPQIFIHVSNDGEGLYTRQRFEFLRFLGLRNRLGGYSNSVFYSAI